MKQTFTYKNFDEVEFIQSGSESEELSDAKEYLKQIQMTINMGDLSDSLFSLRDIRDITQTDEEDIFEVFEKSIFSQNSLNFLEKIKYMTTFEGINTQSLKKVEFEASNNFEYINSNLSNHCKEFVRAIWDCILLIKLKQAKNETSCIVTKLNNMFARLTKIKTGNENAYIKKEEPLDMVCELTLFIQYYISDFLIYLIKSDADISNEEKLQKVNKSFVHILKKSQKIKHRLQMLEQIKSNNYQLLLKLLIDQHNSEVRKKPFIPLQK